MRPKLVIKLNKDFDKAICGKFINKNTAGIDFGAGIIKTHPKLSPAQKALGKKSIEKISEYFNAYYKTNGERLQESVKKAQTDWDKTSEEFYKVCDKYFNKHSWPKGKYEAYLSIINCNPRFLHNKTFQVYWKHKKGFVFVAIHEMLHFLFFDLVEKLLSGIDISSQRTWEISEVFNELIMQETEFAEITGVKDPGQYPNLIELQNKLEEIWGKNKKASKFVLSTLQ